MAQGIPVSATQTNPQPTPRFQVVEIKDGFREVLETIVFVVVLVLLLKSFVAEAFVIPTGSMATTLLGDKKDTVCPECGYPFPVNCHEEVEARPGRETQPVLG